MRQFLKTRNAHLPEYVAETMVILVSLGLFVFIKLAGEAGNGEVSRFDREVLLLFHSSGDVSGTLGSDWVQVIVRDISALGGFATLTMLVAATAGFLWLKGNGRLAIFVVLSIAGGALLNTVLKGLVERPRPDIVPHQTAAALSSFPSGHAMMAAVTYLTLGALLALSSNRSRVKIYFLSWSILITVLVGVSRIYLGVHWPTDILAGWIVGAMWAVFCIFLGARILPGQGRSG